MVLCVVGREGEGTPGHLFMGGGVEIKKGHGNIRPEVNLALFIAVFSMKRFLCLPA